MNYASSGIVINARKAWPCAAIGISILWQGCTYDVAFQKPGTYSYTEKIPIDVAFFMKETVRNKTYEGRAWSSGIANTWVVPVGDAAHEYATAYLAEAFRSFQEVKSAENVPSGNYLVQVNDVAYWMEGQAAHSTVSASVISPNGKEVLNKKYSQDGPSGFGRVFAAGAFAQKSAIRQSTHVVFENIFKNLVGDIRTEYRGWAN